MGSGVSPKLNHPKYCGQAVNESPFTCKFRRFVIPVKTGIQYVSIVWILRFAQNDRNNIFGGTGFPVCVLNYHQHDRQDACPTKIIFCKQLC